MTVSLGDIPTLEWSMRNRRFARFCDAHSRALLSKCAVFKIGNAYDQLETVSGQKKRFHALNQDFCDNQKGQDLTYIKYSHCLHNSERWII